ncbi:hypothetical protein GEMRC1_002506 [Eukaryota sp. GEM-RC1]
MHSGSCISVRALQHEFSPGDIANFLVSIDLKVSHPCVVLAQVNSKIVTQRNRSSSPILRHPSPELPVNIHSRRIDELSTLNSSLHTSFDQGHHFPDFSTNSDLILWSTTPFIVAKELTHSVYFILSAQIPFFAEPTTVYESNSPNDFIPIKIFASLFISVCTTFGSKCRTFGIQLCNRLFF